VLRWSLSSTILFRFKSWCSAVSTRRSPLALPDFRARTRRRPARLRLVPREHSGRLSHLLRFSPSQFGPRALVLLQELISCFLCLQPQCPVRFAGSVILLSSCEICLFPWEVCFREAWSLLVSFWCCLWSSPARAPCSNFPLAWRFHLLSSCSFLRGIGSSLYQLSDAGFNFFVWSTLSCIRSPVWAFDSCC
jgi:hypothetical protein